MARKNYSEDADYYTQDFEEPGVLSVWFGFRGKGEADDADVLQDFCGVGHYRLEDQEVNNFDFTLTETRALLEELSYSSSYLEAVVTAARKLGVSRARWVVVQYDFRYDPAKVTRPIENDPIFVGSFAYSAEDRI